MAYHSYFKLKREAINHRSDGREIMESLVGRIPSGEGSFSSPCCFLMFGGFLVPDFSRQIFSLKKKLFALDELHNFLYGEKGQYTWINEHSETYFDKVSASAVVFQPARHNRTRFFSHMPHHNTLAIGMDCMLGIHYNLITFTGDFTPISSRPCRAFILPSFTRN